LRARRRAKNQSSGRGKGSLGRSKRPCSLGDEEGVLLMRRREADPSVTRNRKLMSHERGETALGPPRKRGKIVK